MKAYPRSIEKRAKAILKGNPILLITGPRQSGKTTLSKELFKDRKYVNLEEPDQRVFAQTDPRGFIKSIEQGAVIDEFQHAPELLSYLQAEVDLNQEMGRFILTGSQNFSLMSHVSQSLAGRVAILQLLPFTFEEIPSEKKGFMSLEDWIFQGGYAPVLFRESSPYQWYGDYLSTYVDRDIRMTLQFRDVRLFHQFLKLAASRSGQLLNLSSLGSDAGVSQSTSENWLYALEVSYLLKRIPAYHVNLNKRVIKTPKILFWDTGLMCRLLGIQDATQIQAHPLRGALFETAVIAEIYKTILHHGFSEDLYFWRDKQGNEVDIILESLGKIRGLECKSGATYSTDALRGLNAFEKCISSKKPFHQSIIYGGTESQQRSDFQLIGWKDIFQKIFAPV